MILRLTGTVTAPVEILPQRRLWLSAVAGQKAESLVLLRRHDGKALHVSEVSVSNPELVEARARAAESPEARKGLQARIGDVWLEVSLKPQSDAVSRGIRVTVKTDVPEEPLVEIPVTIRTRGRIEAIPPQVRFVLPSRGGTGIQSRLHIRNNLGAKMRILKVTTDHPELFTTEILSKDPSSDQLIMVRLTEEAAKKELGTKVFGKLTITTDDPIVKEIEVPVVAWRAPKRRPAPPGQGRVIRRSTVPAPPGGTVLHAQPGKPTPVDKPVASQKPTPSPHGH